MTPWTAARQAPLSMGFSRQGHWSGLPGPPSGDLANPGIKPRSPALQVDSLPSEPPGKPNNIGVGSLSLLQGILPTQELNRGVSNGKACTPPGRKYEQEDSLRSQAQLLMNIDREKKRNLIIPWF